MTKTEQNQIAKALIRVFESPNVSDSNLEDANIVDTLDDIARGLHFVGRELKKITNDGITISPAKEI